MKLTLPTIRAAMAQRNLDLFGVKLQGRSGQWSHICWRCSQLKRLVTRLLHD